MCWQTWEGPQEYVEEWVEGMVEQEKRGKDRQIGLGRMGFAIQTPCLICLHGSIWIYKTGINPDSEAYPFPNVPFPKRTSSSHNPLAGHSLGCTTIIASPHRVRLGLLICSLNVAVNNSFSCFTLPQMLQNSGFQVGLMETVFEMDPFAYRSLAL